MTSTENHRPDESQHAASIARWEDEGGAAKSRPSNAGAKGARQHRRRRRI